MASAKRGGSDGGGGQRGGVGGSRPALRSDPRRLGPDPPGVPAVLLFGVGVYTLLRSAAFLRGFHSPPGEEVSFSWRRPKGVALMAGGLAGQDPPYAAIRDLCRAGLDPPGTTAPQVRRERRPAIQSVVDSKKLGYCHDQVRDHTASGCLDGGWLRKRRRGRWRRYRGSGRQVRHVTRLRTQRFSIPARRCVEAAHAGRARGVYRRALRQLQPVAIRGDPRAIRAASWQCVLRPWPSSH